MRRLAAAALVMVTALHAGACGSAANDSGSHGKPATQATLPASSGSGSGAGGTPRDLEIVESGWGLSRSDGFVDYGFVLRNPNTDFSAKRPTVRIRFKDKNGRIIGGQDQEGGMFILPGQTVAWGGAIMFYGKKPVEVLFTPSVGKGNWYPADSPGAPEAYEPFTVSKMSVSKGPEATQVTGLLRNPNDKAYGHVAVTVILRDANGKIIYGNATFVSHLKPGGEGPFVVGGMPPASTYESIDVYTQLWD